MDVYLVHVYRKTGTLQLPISFGVITNALRMNGIEPKLIDLIPVDQEDRGEFFKRQLSNKPAIYGFSITLGNGHINEVERLAKIAKDANSENIVVYGGPLPSSAPDLLLENCQCSHIIAGEAEIPFPAWIKSVEGGERYPTDIPGLYYRKNGTIYGSPPKKLRHLGPLSNPDYSFFDLDFYIDYLKEIGQSYVIMASRGCLRNCAFCYKMVGSGIALRDVEAVLDEIEYVINRFDLRRFYFYDDDFLATDKLFYEFIEKKKQRGLDFRFILQVRLDNLTEEICRIGKENGLIYLTAGIESVSQKTLDKINKKLSLDDVKKKIRLVDDMDILLAVNLILGFEDETEEDFMAVEEFIKENHLEKRANLSFLTPMPATKIYKDAKSKGLIRDDFDYIRNAGDLGYELYLNMSNEPDEVLEYWYRRIYGIAQRDIVVPKSEKYTNKLSDNYYNRNPLEKRVERQIFS